LQLFRVDCLVYLSSDVRPRVELGDYLKQGGGRNPLPVLNNSPENKYLEAFDPKKLQSRVKKKKTSLSAGNAHGILFAMTNELLFFIHLFLVFAFTIGALRLGKEALIAWIALQSILANLFVLKQTTLFSFEAVCCDVFMLGVVLGLNLLQEYFGRNHAKRAIFISFLAMLTFVIFAKIHLLYVPSASDWSQTSYSSILSQSPRMLLASLTTFFLVQQFDVRFFGWLRSRFCKLGLTWSTVISIILSQAIDTVLFSFLGLYGVVEHILSMIVVCFFIKVIIAISASSVTLLSKKIIAIKPEGNV